jgi:serine/threonine protein kinase
VQVGETFKHYRIVARLGEGGMGVVYRAEDTRLGRTVALKVFPPDMALDPERVERFEREARAASAISHPGIATPYDFDHDGPTAFLTMEYVEGKTLRQLLQQGCLLMPQLLDCLVQVAEALAAAHRKGIIHRDLKPENIMESESGYYKILDFGLARMEMETPRQVSGGVSPTQTVTRSYNLTGEGKILGTISYMSPEQAQGLVLDTRTDIFSFGTVIHELATGNKPFTGNTPIATFHSIVHDEPEPLSAVRPDAPPALERIAAKCLAKDPRERYRTAADLAVDLRTLRREFESGSRSMPVVRPVSPGRRRARGRLMLGAATAAAVAIVGLGGWALLHRGRAAVPSADTIPVAPAAPTFTPTARNRVVLTWFTNQSGHPDDDWLSQSLPEMLTTDLAQSEGLEVISTQRLYDLLATSGRTDVATLDRGTATQLARWAGAGVIIGGSIFRSGSSCRIDVQAHDTTSGRVVAASRVEGDDVFRMADRLAADLRQGLQIAAAGHRQIDDLTTSSPQAFRLFTSGMQLYDDLRHSKAAEEFRRALAADPAFAAAQLRLGMSLLFAGRREDGALWIGRAAGRAAAMPEHERLLAEGLQAQFVASDTALAERKLRELVRLRPREVEPLVWLAQNASVPAMKAIGSLRQALDLDPNSPLAVAALAGRLRALGLSDDADAILNDFLKRNPAAEDGPLQEFHIDHLRND